MTSCSRQIRCGDVTLCYELRRARRKTLTVTVYPDQRITVAAPLKLSQAKVEAFILSHAPWIMGKLQAFALSPRFAPKHYVSGETHLYLGRPYRLQIVRGSPKGVRVDGDSLWVRLNDPDDPERVRGVLEAWYRVRAAEIYAERLRACWPRAEPLGVPWPTMTIRAMRTRWGSARRPDRISLSLKLVRGPLEYIDYVILHELCHFVEPNHSRRYYEVLESVLPEWRQLRAALNAYPFGAA